jgi:putative ABC transport system permease protein
VLLVRTADPIAMMPAIRSLVRQRDPGLAVFGVEPLRNTLDESIGRRRFVMMLLALFAGLAVALSAIGIHVVLIYDVAQRTREIGIRMALGARPPQVMRLVIGRGARLALGGLLIGALASLATTRLLASLLFEVAPTDAATFLVALATLAAITVVASLLPARRAVATDPVAAMRQE